MSLGPVRRSLRVLMVDDHHDGGESCAELLRLYGHEVRLARRCDEAVGSFPPGLVLLDIGLPDGDGYELAARLVALLPRRPVLAAMNGFGHFEGRSRAAGLDLHFLKPVDPGQLAAAIDAARAAVERNR